MRVCSTWEQALAEEGGWVRGGKRGCRGGGGGRRGGVGEGGKKEKRFLHNVALVTLSA